MDFNSSDIYYDFDDNITSQRSRLPVQTNWFPFHAGTAAAAVQTHAACLLFTNKKHNTIIYIQHVFYREDY